LNAQNYSIYEESYEQASRHIDMCREISARDSRADIKCGAMCLSTLHDRENEPDDSRGLIYKVSAAISKRSSRLLVGQQRARTEPAVNMPNRVTAKQ
jgi:hypothetical protein